MHKVRSTKLGALSTDGMMVREPLIFRSQYSGLVNEGYQRQSVYGLHNFYPTEIFIETPNATFVQQNYQSPWPPPPQRTATHSSLP